MSADDRTVYERMTDALADLSHIPKGRSKGVSYEFRGVDALFNELHGVLANHGLFQSPRVLDDWQVNLIPGTPDGKGNPRQQSQAIFRVCVDMYGRDGGMVTLGPGLAQSHDYGDKAVYQAQQNAVKYVLLEAFCVPTEEPDMDGREPDPVPMVDTSRLEDLLSQAADAGLDVDRDRTLEYARRSQPNCDLAAERLSERLSGWRQEKLAGDDSSGGGQDDGGGEAPSDPPPPEGNLREGTP